MIVGIAIDSYATNITMKIAQVAPLYESVPPKLYGGTERIVSFLTEELVRQGHEVTLFASGDSRTSAQLVPVVPESLRLKGYGEDMLAPHFVQLQMVMNQAGSFDFIHFHTDYLNFPFTQNRFPHLTTLHGKLDIPELKALYQQFSDQPVVSISHAQQTALPEANFIGTVHHGLPDQLFKPGKGAGNYFAFLGRISPEKRCDRAIEIAIAANTPLKIAAKVDKADEKYFEQKIKPLMDHPLIEYIGEINDEDKQEFLGEATALLFPIDWPEPFGLVMIEAMACGTPVVAWNRGSVPEVMEHGKNGFIVNSMEEAIQAAIQSSEMDRKQVRQCFDRRFTASRMAKNYLDLYLQLIADHKTKEAKESKSLSIGFRNKDLKNKMII